MKTISLRAGLALFTAVVFFSNASAVEWTNISNFTEATCIALRGNEVWMSAKGGLVVYNKSTGEKTFFKKSPTELPSLSVERVAIHPQTSDIWIGTYDNGLAVLHDNTWTHIPFPNIEAKLYEMKIAPNGAVWSATSKALYRYQDGQFTTYLQQSQADTPWDIDLFPNGKVLCGRFQPFIFNPDDGSMQTITTKTFAYGHSSVYVKNANEYYFATDHGDLASFIDTTEIDTVCLAHMMREMTIDDAGELLMLNEDFIIRKRIGNAWQEVQFATGEISCFAAANGEIWAGGAVPENKIFHRNGQNQIEQIDVRRTGLNNNWVYHLDGSADEKVMMISEGGIQKFDLATRTFSEMPAPPALNIYEAIELDEKFYVGTSTYLYEYTQQNGWRQLGSGILPHTEVSHLAKDDQGNLWMCGYGYAAKYDGAFFTVYDSNDHAMLKQYTRDIHCDNTRNAIWVSTYDGIFKIENGTVSFFNDQTLGIQEFYDAVETVEEDTAHNIWFGTVYGAVLKFDGLSFSTVLLPLTAGNQFVSDIEFIGDIMYVSDNLYGLWKYENGGWTNFNEDNSMLADDFITALHADNEGNLWVAHLSYGIDVYNKEGVSVGIKSAKNDLKALAFPNPSEGKFILQWTEKGHTDIRIYTADGKLAQTLLNVQSGSVLDLTKQGSGVYIADVYSKTGSAKMKLLVR